MRSKNDYLALAKKTTDWIVANQVTNETTPSAGTVILDSCDMNAGRFAYLLFDIIENRKEPSSIPKEIMDNPMFIGFKIKERNHVECKGS